MRIGDIARQAGIGVAALRFYEDEGLLPAVGRRANNYRDFPPETVARVRFIRRAQELGFSLREVREFLRASDGRAMAGPKLAALGREKLLDLDQRVAELRRMQRAIRRVLQGGVKDGPCPIIESLAAQPPAPSRPRRSSRSLRPSRSR